MVLFKRKTVEPLRPTKYPPPETSVWVIPSTGEFFTEYEHYLERLDFYNQRKFICELTGHSCLNYFEAVESEAVEAEKIIKSFPEPLKEPILRKIQFSTISRLDGLVDDVYNQFKHEFFPGEVAIAKVNDQRINVTIREKAKFNAISLPSGEVRPAYCKCRVEYNATGEESIIDESQLTRDRKFFTKIILRTFIKYSVHRESWAGAPWLVKDEYALRYRIDQNIPLHLQKHKGQPSPDKIKQLRQEKREQLKQERLRLKQEKAREAKRFREETKLIQKEQQVLLQRQKQLLKQEQALEAQKLKVKHQKELEHIKQQQKYLKDHQEQLSQHNTHLHELSQSTIDDGSRLVQLEKLKLEMQQQIQEYDSLAAADPVPSAHSINQNELTDLLSDVGTSHETTTPTPKKRGRIPNNASTTNSGCATPVAEEPPVVEKKVPIQDDLLFPYDHDKAVLRPALKRITDVEPPELINPILESWLFLNIYSEPLLLDTFTFDDYLDVLKFDDSETECALLNEIHCALLCAFVGTDKAELLVQLPEPPEDPKHQSEYSDEEEEEEEEEEEDENTNDEEKKKNGEVNDSNNEEEQEQQDPQEEEEEKEPTPEPETNKSQSYTVFKNVDWKERLRRRLFKDGGWQQIIIGLLHTILYVPEWKEDITEILDVLAPLDQPVALYTPYRAYIENLSFEKRVKIIQILCQLLHSSQLVRGYIDKCMEESTRLRRERLENLREYKALLDVIKGFEEQKKAFFPNGIPKPSPPELDEPPIVVPMNGAGNRRGAATSLARQQRKKRKDDAEFELSKTNSEFKKLYTACEEAQAKADELLELNKKGEIELIKLDCQRARMLGKDRYHNRYWWLEGNGFKRQIDTSKDAKNKPNNNKTAYINGNGNGTSNESKKDSGVKAEEKQDDNDSDDDDDDHDLGFLMGRLWVQGPTDEEAQAYLNVEPPRHYPNIIKDDKGQYLMVATSTTNGTDSSVTTKVLIDSHGSVVDELKLAERKSLEEGESCLASCDEWGYYDSPEEIDQLIKWLNPYGKREMHLIQELTAAKTQIVDSMTARKEDLSRDAKMQSEELEQLRESNNDLKALEKADAKDKALLAQLEQEQQDTEMVDAEDTNGDDQPVISRRRRRSTRSEANGNGTASRRGKVIAPTEDDDEEEPQVPQPRRKKRKTSTAASVETIAEIQRRVAERAKEIEELEEDMRYQVKLSRVLSWENGFAKEKLGNTLYESQKKRTSGRTSRK
ncbi:hypothetical protein DS838_004093 [Geotrichum bryndzae]|nr:hypothetical protein DS838_004093 [Geotrichum bryndzae]